MKRWGEKGRDAFHKSVAFTKDNFNRDNIVDKSKDLYNTSMTPYRSAKMKISKYTSPLQAFIDSMEGKYKGPIFSIAIILLFILAFKPMVRMQSRDTSTFSSATVDFISGSVSWCLILLVVIIALQVV
jgi:hypothetical protein